MTWLTDSVDHKMSFDVPWLEGNKLILELLTVNLVEVVHVLPRSSRQICVIDGSSIKWKEMSLSPRDQTSWLKSPTFVNPAERLCLSVMPSSFGANAKFRSILNDPFWQMVLGAADVLELMSS